MTVKRIVHLTLATVLCRKYVHLKNGVISLSDFAKKRFLKNEIFGDKIDKTRRKSRSSDCIYFLRFSNLSQNFQKACDKDIFFSELNFIWRSQIRPFPELQLIWYSGIFFFGCVFFYPTGYPQGVKEFSEVKLFFFACSRTIGIK